MCICTSTTTAAALLIVFWLGSTSKNILQSKPQQRHPGLVRNNIAKHQRFWMERSAPAVVVASTPPLIPFNAISQPISRFPTRSVPLKDVSFLRHDRPSDPPASRLPRRMLLSAEDTELSIFDAEKYFNETSDQKQPPSDQRTPADKYELERASSVCSSIDGSGRNYRNAAATPTASSEASWNSQSGLLTNPPGSMAVSVRKNMRLDDGKKGTSWPRRWFFRRKCPCSGNKSVDVQDKYSPSRNQIAHSNNSSHQLKANNVLGDHLVRKQSVEADEDLPTTAKVRVSAQSWGKDQEQINAGSNRSSLANHELGRKVAFSARTVPFVADVGGFTFPVMNTQSSTIADSAMRAPVNSPEDPPRVSLEVFRPPTQPADHEEISFARKDMLPIYPGEVGRRSFSFAPSPRRRMEDDVASDSSSDLFELESFSTSTNTSAAPIYRRRDSLDELVRFGGGPQMYRRSLDEMSAAVRSAELAGVLEAYEPSEASVEWSVVTADAFDKTSVANFSASASEFGDHITKTLTTAAMHEHKEDGMVGKKKGTAAGGGLLSCRWEKAVSVGPHPVKAVGGVLMSSTAYNQSSTSVVEQSGAAFRVGMARVSAANVVGGGGGSFIHQHHRINGVSSSFSARPHPRAFLHR